MSLFGRDGKPRLVHLKARRQTGSTVLTWDVRHAQALRWRVLRSEQKFAAGAFDDTVIGSGQTLVSDQRRPGSRDDVTPAAGGKQHYTVFAEDERGLWHRLAKVRVDVADRRLGARAEGDFEAGGSRPGSQNPHALDIAQSGDNPGYR
jgi:hypothetical protein